MSESESIDFMRDSVIQTIEDETGNLLNVDDLYISDFIAVVQAVQQGFFPTGPGGSRRR